MLSAVLSPSGSKDAKCLHQLPSLGDRGSEVYLEDSSVQGVSAGVDQHDWYTRCPPLQYFVCLLRSILTSCHSVLQLPERSYLMQSKPFNDDLGRQYNPGQQPETVRISTRPHEERDLCGKVSPMCLCTELPETHLLRGQANESLGPY